MVTVRGRSSFGRNHCIVKVMVYVTGRTRRGWWFNSARVAHQRSWILVGVPAFESKEIECE
jgi:hypothetical protein